ncbi:sugar phosphate isomerase/epimerase family protein [Saccharothrix saharensis]|uniref:sugar phosphate isomerase/epimerase family protein n=1 Tax=Saccharothrix saharensis TaxID=571190 RepID=UPI0036B8D2A2
MSWRFAVSTLGAPGTPLRETARVAAAHGCEGLEIRVHPSEEVHVGMPAAQAARARAQVAEAGLEIACLAGYVKVCGPGPVVDELRALVDLAVLLDAPAVRVFPGGDGTGDGRALDHIAATLPDLRAAGVRLLIETHDSHPTASAALRLVKPFAAPDRVAVLWDAVHPWRAGEPPARTRAVLGEYLGYFQLKDVTTTDPTPVSPGEGDVPLAECAQLLANWSGWVSLEWERAWYPTLPPLPTPLRAAADWYTHWQPPHGDQPPFPQVNAPT